MSGFNNAEAAFIDNMERLFDIFITHIPGAVRYACKVCRYNVDHYEFEDICQDIAILLIEDNYRRLLTFKEKSSIKTWIYTVVKRHVKSRLRRDYKAASFEDIPSGLLISTTDPEASIISREQRKALYKAIAELPKRSQEVFKLSIEGLSDERISLLIGMKVDAVRKSRYKLVSGLRARFEEQRV